MTVAELIEYLQQYPEDQPVHIQMPGTDHVFNYHKVEIAGTMGELVACLRPSRTPVQ